METNAIKLGRGESSKVDRMKFGKRKKTSRKTPKIQTVPTTIDPLATPRHVLGTSVEKNEWSNHPYTGKANCD